MFLALASLKFMFQTDLAKRCFKSKGYIVDNQPALINVLKGRKFSPSLGNLSLNKFVFILEVALHHLMIDKLVQEKEIKTKYQNWKKLLNSVLIFFATKV